MRETHRIQGSGFSNDVSRVAGLGKTWDLVVGGGGRRILKNFRPRTENDSEEPIVTVKKKRSGPENRE